MHGGGFYHSQKYLNAPPHLPEHLHWFKWEAYTTWISGFLLLCVLYYWGAPVYLIDRSKVDFTQAQAILTGLAFIFGGLAVYEGLCRSPIGQRPRLFGLVWFAVLTAAAWAPDPPVQRPAAPSSTWARSSARPWSPTSSW